MALNLAIAQRSVGHHPLLYCIEAEGELGLEARSNGIDVTCFKKGTGKSLRTLWQIARALVHDKADILHTHNPPAHYYGAFAAFLANIPVVNTRHSPISSRGRERTEHNFRWLLPLTNEVVFVSSDAQKRIEPHWNGREIASRVIRNGIPTSRFAGPALRSNSNHRFVFGAVGRLVAVKRFDLLIDAFRVVRECVPDSELQIVGDGPLRDALWNHVAATGLKGSVLLRPARMDIERVFAEFDVFVISSSSEGLPMVVLEAMASSVPIVSTRVGGIAEVVQEGRFGWFCEHGDCDGLAAAMLDARRCADLKKRGEIAAEVAGRDYDIAQVAERYLEVFTSVLQHSGQTKLR